MESNVLHRILLKCGRKKLKRRKLNLREDRKVEGMLMHLVLLLELNRFWRSWILTGFVGPGGIGKSGSNRLGFEGKEEREGK